VESDQITDLQGAYAELSTLKTLEISCSAVKQLPAALNDLKNISTLDFTGCR
jgi:Leucine-rich repeat (LRR) protein